MEKRIASWLNSCKSSNLLGTDTAELQEYITEYFVADPVADEWSDSDVSDEEEEKEQVDAVLALSAESEAKEIDDEVEEPIVCVEGAANTFDELDCNGAVEPALIREAQQWSCNCKQIKIASREPGDQRNGCVAQFTAEEMVAFQLSVQNIDREGKDNLIIGHLSSCMRNGPTTACKKRKEQRDRQKCRSTYCVMARLVCMDTFCKLLCISLKKLKALRTHYKDNGLEPRVLKRGGRKNNTAALTLQETEQVVKFIRQFSEDHAVSLPGRVPGFKREDIRLLPSAYPKSRIFRLYRDSAQAAGYRVVASSTFRKLWLQLCPFIVVARPMTDLCWRCQQNNLAFYRSANLTTEEKQELLAEHQRHLSQVEAERQEYRNMVENSKATVQQHGLVRLHESAPNSRDVTLHYSFDFAQQVHYPSNAAQPGPVYFLTARKCAIFGVCAEGLPQQVNYLVDEAVNVSKGSNAVISYLHHFFRKYALGEKAVELHCDNCSGQNKNRYLLWYCAWRVWRGLHTSISINFMPPGHTKFAPDWCFGLLKRCFRRSEVSCLDDLCDVVRESTAASGVNLPQLVGKEDGTVLVPTYNWHTFFQPTRAFKTLPGIKNIGHFRFCAAQPGFVFHRTTLADQEQATKLCDVRDLIALPNEPDIIPAPGLPRERQEYLYNSIREFVRADKRDLVCPLPH